MNRLTLLANTATGNPVAYIVGYIKLKRINY